MARNPFPVEKFMVQWSLLGKNQVKTPSLFLTAPWKISNRPWRFALAVSVERLIRCPNKSLGIRWLVAAANSKSNTEFHTYADKLASEIMDAAKGEGVSVKKRTDVEKVAEANKAFSHFRW